MYPNWLNPNLNKESIRQNKYLKVSFSQNYEDWYVISKYWEPILKGNKGTYIDLGCYHHSLYSNTKILSTLGWKGVAVDANPFLQQDWMIDRPSDKFYNFAILPCRSNNYQFQTVKLYVFEDGAYNTIDPLIANSVIEKGVKILGFVDVPHLTLPKLAEMIINDLPQHRIDYCSIDLEGVDITNDICEFLPSIGNPKVLTIELPNVHENELSLHNIVESNFVRDLTYLGYRLDSIFRSNIFLYHKDL